VADLERIIKASPCWNRSQTNVTRYVDGYAKQLAVEILSLQPKVLSKELVEFIKWIRDEELVAGDDWSIHCKDRFDAIISQATVARNGGLND